MIALDTYIQSTINTFEVYAGETLQGNYFSFNPPTATVIGNEEYDIYYVDGNDLTSDGYKKSFIRKLPELKAKAVDIVPENNDELIAWLTKE